MSAGFEIAIVGMVGRFPGARNVQEFWRNLRDGVESVRFFEPAELLAAGVPAGLLARPEYVRAAPLLEGADLFDAPFFGYSPKEAEILDPQQRIFLQAAWAALEDSGYDPERFAGLIGLYAGAGMNTYLLNLIAGGGGAISGVNPIEVLIGNDKDYLTTRTAYKLGLEGPAVTVQTACSTALVAVHMASQALLSGECDMALAGGVAVRVPQESGYIGQQGSVFSPDGRCRTFDAGAGGSVFGSGVGVVVLRRLEDALAAGDRVRAVIKGSAINNDGSAKVSYNAPRMDGQAKAIRAALLVADVDPDTIGYVEAHGSATPLGDPIEIAALTKVFRASTQRRGFCAIGSVKTNVGHLEAAAGIAGLIKTVLALEHRAIPASLHFHRPNPEIDFESSPFHVNTALREWRSEGPRRAGVSSFGIGGTNAHLILEEAPPPGASGASRAWQLLCLAAKTREALAEQTDLLAGHLAANPDLDLADAAFTLALGRKAFGHRRVVACRNPAEAAAALRRERDAGGRDLEGGPERAVFFLLPDGGACDRATAAELHASEPTFRRELDRCARLLGSDPLDLPGSDPGGFAVGYALAQLWQEWGVEPQALAGIGAGECLAACLAGALSLEEALFLVAARNRPAELLSLARRLRPRPSRIPWVSSVTGTWLTENQAADPDHWSRALRRTWPEDGVLELTRQPGAVFLELGPGALASWIGERTGTGLELPAFTSLPPAGTQGSGLACLLAALGGLWTAGAWVDWSGFYRHQRRRRVPLPTYPFARERHWVDRPPAEPPHMAPAHPAAPPAATARPARSRPKSIFKPYVPPGSELESRLAGVWEEVLGVVPVGIYDDFLALGGHSLLATRLLSLLHSRFQIDLSLAEFWELSTVADLAQALAARPQAPAGGDRPGIELAGGEGPAPLSYAQQRLWFLEQLAPGNLVHNISRAMRLSGSLDVPQLGRAIAETVRRHDILRTTFTAVDGQPFQVASSPPVILPMIDLTGLEEEARGEELRRLAVAAAQHPFDLERGPLLRILLLDLGGAERVLLLAIHHIISDGWSAGILFQEVADLYRAFVEGRSSPLPELPIQYADFARWQRRWLQGERLEEQLAYWTGRLAGAPPLMTLRTDLPRPGIETFRGARQRFAISSELMGKLGPVIRAERATLFMTLLAAYSVLLRRSSGQDDLVIGTPVANRGMAETEPLIGCFANTVALRCDLSGNPTFRELLGRIRREVLAGYAREEVPFDRVVEALRIERDPSHSPLYQVWFLLQNDPRLNLALSDLRLGVLDVETGVVGYDLRLDIEERPDGLQCCFDYRTDLFTAPTIARFAGCFETLLGRIAWNPQARLDELQAAMDEADLTRLRSQETDLKSSLSRRLQQIREKRPPAGAGTSWGQAAG